MYERVREINPESVKSEALSVQKQRRERAVRTDEVGLPFAARECPGEVVHC